MKFLIVIPYVAILLANLAYFYVQGLDEEQGALQIFLFNFAIMVLLGIFVVINLNILLHRWIVQEE